MNEPERVGPPRRGAPLFDEKSFYLEEFYGKSLLFALIPPGGERLGELDSLVRTLRELRRNQARCIVIVSADALARMMRRLGRLAPRAEPPVFQSRRRPALAALSARLGGSANLARAQRGSIVVAAPTPPKPADFTVFAAASSRAALRVFKLILLDRQGGLTGSDGDRIPSSRLGRIAARCASSAPRAGAQSYARSRRALRGRRRIGKPVAPREVYDETFQLHRHRHALHRDASTASCGQISIDDFEEVEALILRGQHEGFLLSALAQKKSRNCCRHASAIASATSIWPASARC